MSEITFNADELMSEAQAAAGLSDYGDAESEPLVFSIISVPGAVVLGLEDQPGC